MEIKRDRYLEKLEVRKNNGFIKVITGIRRSGKSYLLNKLFYNTLLNSGVKKSQIIKFAFDSAEDLIKIGEKLTNYKDKVNAEKFVKYISTKILDNKQYYLLLDEVQQLENFETVLNGYLRKDNVDVYVTGSNSKFLSSDIITEFEGRGDEIHILPLTFSEFYSVYDGSKEEAFDDYIVYGGLPALVNMKEDEQKITYLQTQIKNVYFKDIVSRNNLFSDNDINELFKVLASGISTLTNPTKLEKTFKSVKKSKISAPTINKYIKFMEDSFLISKAIRYDIKGKHYIDTPYKIYFEDVGLRNAALDFRQIEGPHLMENILYNELRYRGYNVDVGVVESREINNGKDEKKQLEIDFVANKGSKRYYVQSAYSIPDKEKRKQEVRPFDKTKDSFKKIIIVEKTMKPQRDEKGYVTMGIREFLLDENSLDS